MDNPANPTINLEISVNDVAMLMGACTLVIIDAKRKDMPGLGTWAQGMLDRLNQEIRTQVPKMFTP